MSKKNIESIYPLSPTQEGILFHSLQEGEQNSYFQQFSCTLHGLNDLQKWQSCWQLVAQKHAALRTFFTWKNKDQPLQVVRERVTLPWSYADWREDSIEEKSQRFEALLLRDRTLGFDLSVAPLMRFILIRVGDFEYRFLWSFHHILLDGWSQLLLLNDAINLYEQDIISGADIVKAPDYSQFIQFLKLQNEQAAQKFWATNLAGFKTPTHFCTKPIISPEKNHNVQKYTLPSEITEKLRHCARVNRLTLNTLVVAAWSVIHAQKCQTDDVVFGATVAGRPTQLDNAKTIAGLFINTLPVRVKIDNTQPLANWMQNIQQQQIGCRAYENTSLVKIQRSSELASGTALFDSILVFENLPIGDTNANHTLKIADQQYVGFSHDPLAILIDPSHGLDIIVVHKTEFLNSAQAEQIIAALERVLTQLCCADFAQDKPSSLLKMAQLDSKHSLLVETNPNEIPTAITPVHQAFEYWASQTPDAIALVVPKYQHHHQQIYSYAKLNNKANQLAHLLAQQGVGLGHFVAVVLDRNADALVCFLAALKLGAAYIPISTDTPATRLTHILEDLDDQPYVVITHSLYRDNIPDCREAVLCVDELNLDDSALNRPNPNISISGDTLAYVIYTSGSSGKPKGVMVEHQHLLNSTQARGHYYAHTPQSFLLLSSLSTDSSVAGLYWTLTNGCTLVLSPPQVEQNPEALTALIATYAVTHILCIPSLYQVILEHGNLELCTSLQTIIVAGEACTHAVIKQHHQHLPNVQLHNEYGPSECTVWATAAKLSSTDNNHYVSIGLPIANTCAYILDSGQHPVPDGEVGELYLGGANVARGYLNQELKTAAVFVADPFVTSVASTKARMYRTGDLVRRHNNGHLEFVGRIDNQLKVRGFRIEPQEIETNLATHPGVTEAVVFLDKGNIDKLQDSALLSALSKLPLGNANALLDRVEKLTETDVKEANHDT